MPTPHQLAADEIFRDVVNGPETTGPREIVAILEKHFPPIVPGRPLHELLAEQDPDDADEEPQLRRGRVLSPFD